MIKRLTLQRLTPVPRLKNPTLWFCQPRSNPSGIESLVSMQEELPVWSFKYVETP